VDAYPAETFKGDVRQVRLQPVVTSNVVTYTVIVNAPNPEKKLMPGMTANITVLVQKIDSVLIVPGKAFRFVPDAAWLAEYQKNNPFPKRTATGDSVGSLRREGQMVQEGQSSQSVTAGQSATGQATGNQRQQNAGVEGRSGTGEFQGGGRSGKKPVLVWVKSGDKIHRTRVVTGTVDGSNAEVRWGLKEGDEVILSMSLPGKSPAAAAAPATSPFMPQRPGTTRR
jgi:HlyD family secretion protein